MNLRWLVGSGLVAGFFLIVPACGSDDSTSPDAGVTTPDGGLADVTTKPDGSTTDASQTGVDGSLPPPTCNDGRLDIGETCDPLSSCPTECPALGCQLRTLDNGGTCTAICDDTVVQTTCLNGDDCCPTNCNTSNDSDCKAVCGNGIVEPGETCDGNCPTTCPNFGCQTMKLVQDDPTNACTFHCEADTKLTTCSTTPDSCCPSVAMCPTDPDCATGICGNGVVDTSSGETCDPDASGAKKCPTSCPPPAPGCDIITLVNPDTCQATCQPSTISACANGDGCCPSGCNAGNDTDCSAVCGNHIVEPGEDCDGNCPTSCPQEGCQEYTLQNKGPCNITCQKSDLQTKCINNDQCCPSSCTSATDNDCGASGKPVCGDGITEPPETCDGNCPNCPTAPACFQNTGQAQTCNLVCDVPIEACGGANARDNCCPYAKTTGPGGITQTCGASTDQDCTGTTWLSVSTPTATMLGAGQCATFVISNVTNGGAYDFTTCAPTTATRGTGNPRIGNATQAKGSVIQNGSDGQEVTLSTTTYQIANDNCTDPSALPVLAGWTCENQGNVVTMACASADSGGFISSSSNAISVTVCASPDLATTFPFTVFYNSTEVPTITPAGSAMPANTP